MKYRFVLAAACAALAGGIAATSAQAAPASGHLAVKQSTDVQKVHYDNYRQRPWWGYSRRYDNYDPYRNQRIWRKRHHERDWSRRDDDRHDRDSDNRRDRRDW
jgi:hypothetical protein